MSLKDDLEAKVKEIFREQWSERDGQVVPEPSDLRLGNDAVKLDGVVLYADMSESTQLVDTKKAFFAAEIYKSFLHCAAKIIRSEGGEITSYDGDRIMAVFIGDSKNTSAARAALKINYARIHIINPALKAQYPDASYEVKHTVGVDASKLFIARTGIRGSNDLVWVGRAANHAAKMGGLSNNYPSRISSDVYDMLNDSVKFSDGVPMWEKVTWNDMDRTIYRSTWWWSVS
ncbi:MAG: adenylate/guanylate cyclase domain-containing protein [Candidatus Thiodiazotropha sp. (ex. Lucinisca nassula)]|nr:adenylate/guanylate cyclase domain-containing protein [Candidatus Thiodiazotropha sp. (ex. Lucinisca nassula)]